MVVQMINVGEQTGGLDEMLNKVADFYDSEVDSAVDAMTSILEPLMIVFLGVVVGGMVVAMYLPIFDIIKTSSNARLLLQPAGTAPPPHKPGAGAVPRAHPYTSRREAGQFDRGAGARARARAERAADQGRWIEGARQSWCCWPPPAGGRVRGRGYRGAGERPTPAPPWRDHRRVTATSRWPIC